LSNSPTSPATPASPARARASHRSSETAVENPPRTPPDEAAAIERVVLDDQAIRRALMRMAHEIVESADGTERLYLVAIPNGGVPLGRILVDNLESLTGARPPLGILDTTLYRDDLTTRGSRPQLRRTEMPSSVDDRVVVLVEDVVSTGRTIRAAMDALMDFGRPSHVRVVALVDRGHRELPIKIDYVGKNIPTQPSDKVVFRADEPAGERTAPPGGADSDEEAAPVGPLELVVRAGAGA
jgi:pyrimidine operon attenuation protein/uracil phosphoribosyltransferase